jgi:phenylacetic acid degradation operon negative regulatory protein
LSSSKHIDPAARAPRFAQSDPATIAAQLVERFRRQRPLRGGSLIVTIFGDSIMPRGGAIALGSLIRVASPFGLNERLVRTATARLAQDGWLEGRRAGNLSEYRLSAGGRERFAEATLRIYAGPFADWSGRWSLIVLPPMRAAKRKKIRQELNWRGFGEIGSGVFAHPETLPADPAPPELAAPAPPAHADPAPPAHADPAPPAHADPAPPAHADPALPGHAANLVAGALCFDARLADEAAAARLVALGWNLAELAKKYRGFVQRFSSALAACQAHTRMDPEAAFVIRTLLIHEYRRLHLRDPLLPARLLHADWPGTRAAVLCRDIYARVFEPSEAHLSRIAAQLDGKLPAPDPSVLRRFGGI